MLLITNSIEFVIISSISVKITHPSKLLEIQQNLSDDQAKAKLRVGRYVFKMDKMSPLFIDSIDSLVLPMAGKLKGKHTLYLHVVMLPSRAFIRVRKELPSASGSILQLSAVKIHRFRQTFRKPG